MDSNFGDLNFLWIGTLYPKIKKFGEGRETDFKARQKQMQFMNYRGFTRDQIQYAVNGD